MRYVAAIVITLHFMHNACANERVLKACTTEWPPYVVASMNNEAVQGTHTHLLQNALQSLGISVQIDILPWKRCLAEVKAGRYDLIYSVSYSEERAEFLLFPQTPLQELSYVFATKDTTAEAAWARDHNPALLPQPIGVPLGFSVAAELRKIRGVKLDEGAIDDRANLEKLAKDRVKTILVEPTAFEVLANGLHYENLSLLQPAFVTGKAYFVAVSKRYGGDELEAQALTKQIGEAIVKNKKLQKPHN